MANTKETYRIWNENLTPLKNEDDELFFKELVKDVKTLLDESLNEIQKEVESLQIRLLQMNSPEECAADEKLKTQKAELERTVLLWKNLRDKISDKQNSLEKNKKQKSVLKLENEVFKQKDVDLIGKDTCNAEEVAKQQSEAVSLRNIIKLKDIHETDINNECYAADLVNARLQGKLDEVRLQRDALLQLCTSEYVILSELHITLNYGNDNSKIVTEFVTHMKEKKKCIDNVLKELAAKEKSYKVQMNEGEEKLKKFEKQITMKLVGLEQYEKDLLKEKKALADLRSQFTVKNEEYAKKEEMQISLKHAIEMESALCLDLQKELQILNDSFLEQESKFSGILKCMGKELVDYVKQCKEVYLSSLKS